MFVLVHMLIGLLALLVYILVVGLAMEALLLVAAHVCGMVGMIVLKWI